MPKVSVIIPVYGVEKYIEKCAISLFEQTLGDIELIFVDDCTPDNSMGILNNVINQYQQILSKTHKTVKLERMPRNMGQASVRRYGVQCATGDYIIYCDSDDWVEKNAYEVLYNTALATDSDIVFCNYYSVVGDIKTPIHSKLQDTTSRYILKALLVGGFMGSLWKALCNRKLYSYVYEYPSSDMIEDLALLVQLVYYSEKCTIVPDHLYYYYFRNTSASYKEGFEVVCNRVKNVILNTDLIIRFLDYVSSNRDNVFQNEILSLKVGARTFAEAMMPDKRAVELWKTIYPEIEKSNIIFSKISLSNKLHYYSVKLGILPQIRILKRNIYNPLIKFLGKSTSHSDTWG